LATYNGLVGIGYRFWSLLVGRGEVIDYYREHTLAPVAEKFSFEFDQALERLS
jgi:hypothetical protein